MTFEKLLENHDLPLEDDIAMSHDEEVAIQNMRIGWNSATQRCMEIIADVSSSAAIGADIKTVASIIIQRIGREI